ncbi:hypothetical protein TSOC_005495 [Tetrabaena socialis]|uniref:Uncharacterized protein n=1 Tax=Tetrabaena socialis TaxID=47790 RepID=A0A2J8A641_9CHLO|nr:hypothetical protein TSOC_005495 [Tetrabaena socialis]|eukprot:PNH07996.1 hypothetical protein TSOC_005495 [Tetrabaena socialis]
MAEGLARSSGTDEDVLQRVQGQDFLMSCLRKAKFSADLLQDTADACDINDLNALVLASGIMTVTEASEKLFLMQDEASTVVAVCRKECLRAGVNFGDGAKLTPEELAEGDNDAPPAVVQAPPAPLARAPSQPAPGKPEPAAQPTKPAGKSGTAPTASSSTPPAPAAATAPSAGATSSVEHPDPNFLIKPPVAAAPAAGTSSVVTPQPRSSHIPKPTAGTPATPAATATPRVPGKPAVRASPSTATPQQQHDSASKAGMNGKHAPTPVGPSSSAAKPPRPSTAPLTVRASLSGPLPKDRPTSATPTATPPVKPPSYAKPTASHKARVLKEDSDAASSSVAAAPVTFASTNKPLRRFLYMPPRPTSASTPEEKKEPKRPIFDNIRSSLLRPTAAFLAWSQGKGKQGKEADLRSSQKLQSDGGAATARAKPPPPPSAKSVSKSESPGAASGASGAGSKSANTTPFRLASAERHQKAQEELARKKEEKARLEANVPQFKASPMPGAGGERPPSAARSPKVGTAVQTEA